MKRREVHHIWINPFTGDTRIVYEPPTPDLAKAFVVILALTIPFWVLS